MSLKRRQRSVEGLVQNLPSQKILYRYANNNTVPGWPDEFIPAKPATKKMGDQVTDSEEHPGWRQRLKDADSRQDIGGDFFTRRRYVEGVSNTRDMATLWQYLGSGIYKQVQASGPVWAIDARLYNFPEALSSPDSTLDELGAIAVARCRPTNSAANLGVALGELVREGIPKLAVNTWKRRAKRPEKLSSEEYLAYQFGLAPLGQEIGTFAAEVLRADQLLAQYERDAGRVVRRRYEFPTKTESSLAEVLSVGPLYGIDGNTEYLNPALTYDQHRMVKVRRDIEQKRWFAGAFTYALPFWYDASSEMSRQALLAKEILGLDLDEEVIWNLTPWSWAADWFTNADEVISNVSSYREDGLLMRYGYMMEHTIVKDTYTRLYPNTLRYGSSLNTYVTLVTETKIRRHANPFGFGVTWDGLTAFQTSILTALGISRKK